MHWFACRHVWAVFGRMNTHMLCTKKCHLHAECVNKSNTMNHIEEFKICYNDLKKLIKSAALSLRPLLATRLT